MTGLGSRPPELEPQELGEDEIVTQRISRGRTAPPDINEPRPNDRGKVSLIRGRVTPSTAYHLVRKGGQCGVDDGARYAEVRALRGAGFIVRHTPTNRNPGHCSVSYPGDWDEDVALLFKSCFTEHVWHERGESDE
jgi:hypothetical protein